MKRMRFATILLSVLWILSAGAARGQDSPHGPLLQPCTDCHTTDSWNVLLEPMKFDHATTSFPLHGQHRVATCKGCHTNLHFAGTQRICISCHLKDFNETATINHRAAGFTTDCTQCHEASDASWQSSFDHSKTQFPTRGAHDAVACITCHTNNRFRGTPVQCIACHQRDYAAAQNPNHASAGFSTDCATCHRALTWQPAAFFPHDYFPIAAGATHQPGRWSSCTDCHPAQPNYSTFECINCHEHNKPSMDSRHGEVQGYVYQSSACYRCHPNGERP